MRLRKLTALMAAVGATLPMIGLFGGMMGYMGVAFLPYDVGPAPLWKTLLSGLLISGGGGLPPAFLVLAVFFRQMDPLPTHSRRRRLAATGWVLLCAGAPLLVLLAVARPESGETNNWLLLLLLPFYGALLAASLAIFVNARPRLLDVDMLQTVLAGAGGMAVAAILILVCWNYGVLVIVAAMIPASAFWLAVVARYSLKPYFPMFGVRHVE
jgi:hypothetical protein